MLLSKGILNISVPLFTFAATLLILSLSLEPMAYSATNNNAMIFHVSNAPKLGTYQVELTPHPKSENVAPGGTAVYKITEKNTGAKSFVVFGCKILIKPASSKKYESIGCSTPTYTMAPGKTLVKKLHIGVSPSTPPGKYDIKFYLIGTVGKTTYNSEPEICYDVVS